ncbi:MAG: ABC transporter permease [Candidatus Parabeggiatoa sp. nov. 1]|nr:MAG: ABC transporter permease [Gammaproteobacteria bacterium]
MNPSQPTQPKGIIARLALLDLRHEWVLSLCMVLAIAAVLAPLLILLGLKHGTIQTMRDRLVEDPVNREIRPARTLQLSTQWFEDFKQRPDVEFLIPTILRGSSIVRLSKPGERKRLVIDLVPTAPSDPLILENEGVVPKKGECVLSYAAAEELGVKTGAVLTAEVTRTRKRRRESERTDLRVVAVLNPRADALERIYTPFAFVNDVEAYREGRAVPTRNWPGGKALPPLSYDGLWVLMLRSLSAIEETTLTIGTGLADIHSLNAAEFRQQLGFPLPDGYSAYQLLAKGSPILASSIKRVKNKLRGKSAILLPYAQAIEIKRMTGETLKVIGLSLSESQTSRLGLPKLPWGKFNAAADFTKQGQMLFPRTLAGQQSLTLSSKIMNGEIEFPVTQRGLSFGDYAIVPAELIGTLRTGQASKIVFDETQQTFLLAKAGYRGFRLYARSIDDIPTLYREFISQNMDVMTQVHEIEKVKVLDRGLTRIFWLVAIVGIVGGMAALIASLYASVERKKRDISVLRLMGLSRTQVFQFPIYQGITIAVISVVVAIGGYALLSSIINLVFAADLKMGQKICTLPYNYLIITFFVTAGMAALSSLLAAWKTTGIDPAEAIREE